MKLQAAFNIAYEIAQQLQQHCDKIYIAGSIRRRAEEVGDIEIVCLPQKIEVGQASLFGEPAEVAATPEFTGIVNALGTIKKGNANGRYMCIDLPAGIQLDLFMPQPSDFYRQLAIRTGNRTYAAEVIANAWVKLGWCGTKHGLRRRTDCIEDGCSFKWINTAGEIPPVWQSELEFFSWLKIPYLKPEMRNM